MCGMALSTEAASGSYAASYVEGCELLRQKCKDAA